MAPIFAEQHQVVTRALRLVANKQRLGDSSQDLGTSVLWNLADRGIRLYDDEFAEAWDAQHWRATIWVIRFTYTSRKKSQSAEWELDLRDGILLPRNRLASDLGYVEPGRRRKRLPPLPERVAPKAADSKRSASSSRRPATTQAARPAAKATKKKTTAKATKKKATAKKVAKKPTAKKKVAAKKVAKKPTAKKKVAKKAPAKKAPAKKAAKKAPAKKAAKKAPARKAAKKATKKKAPAKKAAKRPVARAAPTRSAPRAVPATTPRPTVARRQPTVVARPRASSGVAHEARTRGRCRTRSRWP